MFFSVDVRQMHIDGRHKVSKKEQEVGHHLFDVITGNLSVQFFCMQKPRSSFSLLRGCLLWLHFTTVSFTLAVVLAFAVRLPSRKMFRLTVTVLPMRLLSTLPSLNPMA